jgi:integrase-like protein
VADFHALRHTFITELVRAGVAPKDAKELARHSTITLTMDRYAHVGIRDTAAAVARLNLPTSARPDTEPAALRATRTDDGCTAYVPPDVPAGEGGRVELRPREERAAGERGVQGDEKTPAGAGVGDDREGPRGVCPTGVEPVTFGSGGQSCKGHSPRRDTPNSLAT